MHACNRLRDDEEAKDLIHELFAHFWNKIGYQIPKMDGISFSPNKERSRL
jgi:hypothetical protein